MLKMLWLAWQERPPRYTDATGASLAMSINSQFLEAFPDDEHSGIPVVKEESSKSPYVLSRSVVEVNVADYYGPALHRLRLSVDQAQLLQAMLNSFFSSSPSRLAHEEAKEKLRALAAYVCDVFDQADTSHAIENLGSRGKIVRDAIEELKQVVIDAGGKVALPPPTEQYRQFPRRG